MNEIPTRRSGGIGICRIPSGWGRHRPRWAGLVAVAAVVAVRFVDPGTVTAQGVITAELPLIVHMSELQTRLDLGDPGVVAVSGVEGPKDIAEADFTGDGTVDDLAISNLDGTVTLLVGVGGGDFAEPRHLATGFPTGAESLRGDRHIRADLAARRHPWANSESWYLEPRTGPIAPRLSQTQQ